MDLDLDIEYYNKCLLNQMLIVNHSIDLIYNTFKLINNVHTKARNIDFEFITGDKAGYKLNVNITIGSEFYITTTTDYFSCILSIEKIVDITPKQFQEMYDDDPKLLQLSTVMDVTNILKAMKYIKNLPEFIKKLQEIRDTQYD